MKPFALLPDSLGPKMLACSERERKFVWFYVTGDGNASQAARDAGYADPGPESASIRVRAHELTHRQRVQEAIREVASREFNNLLPAAVRATKALIESGEHQDHAKAVLSTLSRLGFAERSGVDVQVSGQVTINHTDEALEQLRTLQALGVPREKLIEVFGYSGLERYEKMLEIQPRLIEAKVVEND